MKLAVWDRPGQRVAEERLASQPTHFRLIDTLAAAKANRQTLRQALATCMLRHQRAAGSDHAVRRGTLDMDRFPMPICGTQAGGAYQGYYRDKVYHPLVASFAADGDYDSPRLGDGFVHAILRHGHADSDHGAVRFIFTDVAKARLLTQHLDLRIHADFTSGPVMDTLCDRASRFVGRLRNNAALDKLAAPDWSRTQGRPPKEGYVYAVDRGPYRVETWRHAQRLIGVIVDKRDARTGQLNLLPEYFFLIRNWPKGPMSDLELLEPYRKRGTFEDRLGEFNQAIDPRCSSPEFAENEATFLRSRLAFNLGGILRGEMAKATPDSGWDLRRLVVSVLKAGGRVVQHSRRLIVDLAASAAPLWSMLLERIGRWRLPTRWAVARRPVARPWMPPPHAHLGLVLGW